MTLNPNLYRLTVLHRQLDDAERDHLFDLARIDNAARATKRASTSTTRIKPVVRQVLDAITDAAADIRNERGDIIAANKLGAALYSETHAETVQPPNVARYTAAGLPPHLIAGSGHSPMVEKPDEFLAAVGDFVR